MKLSNRLNTRVADAKKKKEKLFCAFLTLGYPSIASTKKLILEMDKAGVDIIELGFPFSDPLADGPTIQYASEQVLKKGVSIQDAFEVVKEIRAKGCEVPIVFFGYMNPILHYGPVKFAKQASQAGFDGLIIPDLPPEEEPEFQTACRKANLSEVFLVAPTTEKLRAKKISSHSSGFVYYVSLRGVTGARKTLPSDVKSSLKKVSGQIKHPVLIGFGVSTPEQGKAFAKISDGVIVGSAIVNKIREHGTKLEPTIKFIRQMVKSVKAAR